MYRTTYDRDLTGVHWPIHRGWCMGSGTKGDLSTSTGSAPSRRARTEAVLHVAARVYDGVIIVRCA